MAVHVTGLTKELTVQFFKCNRLEESGADAATVSGNVVLYNVFMSVTMSTQGAGPLQ